MSTPVPPPSDWELAQLLMEPHRRTIFECVRRSTTPLTRDDIARLTGISRRLATFHLDRLSDAGLLLTHFARPPGRKAGPGAGRPAKHYRAADVEFDVSVPPRRYELATRLLAQAICADSTDAFATSRTVARAEGRRIGELRRGKGRRATPPDAPELIASLAGLGYEPSADDSPSILLRNCPFRSAADLATDLVCGLNMQLIAGLLEGLGLDPTAAHLEPAPPNCCVTVTLPG